MDHQQLFPGIGHRIVILRITLRPLWPQAGVVGHARTLSSFHAVLRAGAKFSDDARGRAAAGFFAAATRVVAISIVRDRYIGDRMASIMSTIFIVFMIVPVLAPTFGQVILYFANWRWIFGALLLIGALITGWVAFRLPETLTPENRIGISLSDIGATFANIITNRSAFGYMVAAGIALGALVGFITSVQQIF